MSFLRAAMRTSLQSSFYTIDKALNGPSLAATIAVFVWCLMFHVISSIPQPGIYSEGYNHGGIFIDFIGQGMLCLIMLT